MADKGIDARPAFQGLASPFSSLHRQQSPPRSWRRHCLRPGLSAPSRQIGRAKATVDDSKRAGNDFVVIETSLNCQARQTTWAPQRKPWLRQYRSQKCAHTLVLADYCRWRRVACFQHNRRDPVWNDRQRLALIHCVNRPFDIRRPRSKNRLPKSSGCTVLQQSRTARLRSAKVIPKPQRPNQLRPNASRPKPAAKPKAKPDRADLARYVAGLRPRTIAN